jgi:hypothetical protein
MAAAPTDDRAIGPELLALEVLESDMLSVRVGVDDRPPTGSPGIKAVLGAHKSPNSNGSLGKESLPNRC